MAAMARFQAANSRRTLRIEDAKSKRCLAFCVTAKRTVACGMRASITIPHGSARTSPAARAASTSRRMPVERHRAEVWNAFDRGIESSANGAVMTRRASVIQKPSFNSLAPERHAGGGSARAAAPVATTAYPRRGMNAIGASKTASSPTSHRVCHRPRNGQLNDSEIRAWFRLLPARARSSPRLWRDGRCARSTTTA